MLFDQFTQITVTVKKMGEQGFDQIDQNRMDHRLRFEQTIGLAVIIVHQ